MTVGLLGASSWSWAGRDADLEGDPCPEGLVEAAPLERPARYSPGNWRRMSRLARLCAVAAEPLLDLRPDSVIIGLLGGEYASGVAFLRSYFTRGPSSSSPLAFQSAVHNAPAGHISIDAGLHGWSETLLGGTGVVWDTIERAACRVQVRGGTVLVVVADELGPDTQAGMRLAGVRAWGESAAALVLGPSGRPLVLHDGSAPAGAWGRAAPYLDEPPRQAPARAWDRRFGPGPGSELAALAALSRSGGALAGDGRWLELP